MLASPDLLRLWFNPVCSAPLHSIWICCRIKNREAQRMNGELARDTALLPPSLGLAAFRSAPLQTCLEVFFCAWFPRGPSSLVSPEKADLGGASTASVSLVCLLFLKGLCWEAGPIPGPLFCRSLWVSLTVR